MSAHWDHIAVGNVARRIAKKLSIPLAAFTVSPEFKKQRNMETLLARRKFGKYAGVPAHRNHDFRIKIDLATKRKAIRSHVSQFGRKDAPGNVFQIGGAKTVWLRIFRRGKSMMHTTP